MRQTSHDCERHPRWLQYHYRLRFEGEYSSSDIMVRVPQPAAAVPPGERVLYEAATAEYIRLNTRVPDAQVLTQGSWRVRVNI